MTRDDIIRKVIKCLALSKSSNRHESASALARAQSLMEKHGVSRIDIELAEIYARETFACRCLRPPRYISGLVDAVKRAFGCDAVFSYWWKGSTYINDIEFIGVDPRPEIAVYAFDVLRRQLERGRRQYIGRLSKRYKRSNRTKLADHWAEGWVLGVLDRIKTVVISKADRTRLDAWKARRYQDGLGETKARAAKNVGIRAAGAFVDGQLNGREAELHRAMGGGRDQELLNVK